MSSEYGWTDEYIGELPLARFRQITAAIQIRRYSGAREENSRYSWLARNLAGFIAAGYMLDKGKDNPALKMAAELAYDDVEAALLGRGPSQDSPSYSGDPETKADVDAVADQNGRGSFERFLMMDKQTAMRGKMI